MDDKERLIKVKGSKTQLDYNFRSAQMFPEEVIDSKLQSLMIDFSMYKHCLKKKQITLHKLVKAMMTVRYTLIKN